MGKRSDEKRFTPILAVYAVYIYIYAVVIYRLSDGVGSDGLPCTKK